MVTTNFIIYGEHSNLCVDIHQTPFNIHIYRCMFILDTSENMYLGNTYTPLQLCPTCLKNEKNVIYFIS